MKLPIQLSNDSREPIYHQIENQLKALIAGGLLPAGSALPSIRKLSKELEISVITTRRAYQNLEYEGYIKTSQGKGTFVADVDEAKKRKVKETSVWNAFREAIDIAVRYDYPWNEIEKLFHQVMEERKEINE